MTTENIATLEEIQEATINMQTVNEEVKSTANTLVDQYGTTRKTMAGRENEFDAQLASQESSFINRFALSDTPIAWSAGLLIEDELQLYSTGTKGESGYSVWLPNPNQLPFTTSATFSEDDTLNRWRVQKTITELQSIARSLNVPDSAVIYSTNTTTVLDDVLYIYDASEQITYAKPADVGVGEVVVSVDSGVLTTDAGTYDLLLFVDSNSRNSVIEFKNDSENSAVDNMIAGIIDGIATVKHQTGNIYSTGNTKWRLLVDSPSSEFDFQSMGSVHVDDFGARADFIYNSTSHSGTGTDSTTSIQRAVNYCWIGGLCGSVDFSSGNYRITDRLMFPESAAPRLRGFGRYRSYGETSMFMDSVEPKYMLERPQHIEGIWLVGVQDRLHTGIMGGGYRGTYSHMRFLNLNIGINMSGVFVDFYDTNFGDCNFGVRALYLSNSTYNTSTMFGFNQTNFLNCDVGFTSVDEYPDYTGEYVVLKPLTVTSNGLRNVKFEEVGFEQCRVGLTSNNRIWNLSFINSWTEANSEYGIYFHSDTGGGSVGLTMINSNNEETSEDKWVYPVNSQYGGSTRIATGSITTKSISKEYKGVVYKEPIQIQIILRTSDFSVVKGSELVSSFGLLSGTSDEFVLLFTEHFERAGVHISSVNRGSKLTPAYSVTNTASAGDVASYGTFNSMYISFLSISTETPTAENPYIPASTKVIPAYIVIDFTVS